MYGSLKAFTVDYKQIAIDSPPWGGDRYTYGQTKEWSKINVYLSNFLRRQSTMLMLQLGKFVEESLFFSVLYVESLYNRCICRIVAKSSQNHRKRRKIIENRRKIVKNCRRIVEKLLMNHCLYRIVIFIESTSSMHHRSSL